MDRIEDKDKKDWMFHRLDVGADYDRTLNNPFYYRPDKLIIAAADELKRNLPATTEEGKMWGVLVVEKDGQTGFLNAFSGQLCDADRQEMEQHHSEWIGCPPIFDYLQPDGYFKTHEAVITDINHQIDRLTSDSTYLKLKQDYKALKKEAEAAIEAKRKAMTEAKESRNRRRAAGNLTNDEKKVMEKESQFLKAEVHRAKLQYRTLLDEAAKKIKSYEEKTDALKRRRSILSDQLQSWLFGQFVLLNAKGERKPMPEVFSDYFASTKTGRFIVGSSQCPSGAGECCEPKMLQYAYAHGMRPIRMASFWWEPNQGDKSKGSATELRRHGNFYPACSGRCKPILSWMLQGLDVAPSELTDEVHQKLKMIYEDDYLAVVAKPSGMLSVPGNSNRESVVSILRDRWNGTAEPLVVHRLDMATSGLMIVAKDADTHRKLRKQFEAREIEKEYEALVVGTDIPVPSEKFVTADGTEWDGEIALPLIADLMDRPRQKVDFTHGKPCQTLYKVLSTHNGETHLRLKPLTGRTHQLRVHCASALGLNAPIKGDTLYGQPDGRMWLHATRIVFTHPQTGRRKSFSLPFPKQAPPDRE